MRTIFYKVWGWYKSLPWWGKVIGVFALLLVGVLGILYVVSKFLPGGPRGDLKDIDNLTREHFEERIDDLKDDAEEITKNIRVRKKSMARKINQAGKIDAKALERREKIVKATTMEELDRLQEELDL